MVRFSGTGPRDSPQGSVDGTARHFLAVADGTRADGPAEHSGGTMDGSAATGSGTDGGCCAHSPIQIRNSAREDAAALRSARRRIAGRRLFPAADRTDGPDGNCISCGMPEPCEPAGGTDERTPAGLHRSHLAGREPLAAVATGVDRGG